MIHNPTLTGYSSRPLPFLLPGIKKLVLFVQHDGSYLLQRLSDKLSSVPPSTPRQYLRADCSARGSLRPHRKHLATRRSTMAGVMHDPEVVAYEECTLYEEQPP